LGAENFPAIVKTSFLPEVLFVLRSYHFPTFVEPILANQPVT
jgi:hypothetical protein